MAVGDGLNQQPTLFDHEINSLLGWVQFEMAHGRLTAVQTDFLNRKAVALEKAHEAGIAAKVDEL